MDRTIFDEEHELFRESFRQFVSREVTPHFAEWERAGIVPRELFLRAGDAGFLAIEAPVSMGGGGIPDFRFNAIITEELMAAGHAGVVLCFSTHNDVCLPYILELGSEEQRERWLPGICSGELICAIALTEPHAGSDLRAIRSTATSAEGGSLVLNGSKTFITNGLNADLIISAVKVDSTNAAGGNDLSLVVLERGMPGLERGRNLEKVGLHCQDTAELSFHDVCIPPENLLGELGAGLPYLMQNLPRERLGIAIAGMAGARAALGWTLDYTKSRTAFGQPIATFQNSKFRLAEVATEVEVAQAFIDRCIEAINSRTLTPEDAAMAKWWCTELQKRTVDTGVQLHGGYGYMLEYQIARAYLDARITTIFGGTTEIMKEVIARHLIR